MDVFATIEFANRLLGPDADDELRSAIGLIYEHVLATYRNCSIMQ